MNRSHIILIIFFAAAFAVVVLIGLWQGWTWDSIMGLGKNYIMEIVRILALVLVLYLIGRWYKRRG